MAPKMCVSVVVAAIFFAVVAAQSPPDCTAAIQTMLPCLSYVTGGASTPGTMCCQAITTLNTNNPACLCQSVSQLDLNPQVNRTRALSLPKECNVAIDTSTCPALAAPPMPDVPSLPPLPAVPPTMFTPPSGPVSSPGAPGSPPVASGPSTGSPASQGTSPAPSVSGASAIRSSFPLCVAAVGAFSLALL